MNSGGKKTCIASILAMLVLSFLIICSHWIAGAEEDVDQVVSKLVKFAGEVKDIAASGTFERVLVKRSMSQIMEEKLSGNFNYKAVGASCLRVDRSFSTPAANGAIGDTLFAGPNLCVWNECFPDIASTGSLGKVWKNKICVHSESLQEESFSVHVALGPFEINEFVTAIPEAVVKSQEEEGILIRLVNAQKLNDARWALEISHPVHTVQASSAFNLRGVLGCELRGLEPLDIAYISDSMLQPDGRKDLVREIFLYNSAPCSDIALSVPREVKHIDYSIHGDRKGKPHRSVNLKIDKVEINTGITAEELAPEIPEN